MTNRQMPPNVRPVPDRHGKIRYRYRKSGVKGGYLPGEPWSTPWLRRLAELQDQVPAAPESQIKIKPRSLDDLGNRVRQSLRWQRQQADTRKNYGRIMDQMLDRKNKAGVRFGDRDCRQVSVVSLDRTIAKDADKPSLARKQRQLLIKMFDLAVKLGYRTDNPARMTDTVLIKTDGYHTWTDAEIAQYRAHHAIGSMARLVLELTLNSAGRRCNIATLQRSQIVDGLIYMDHAKDGDDTIVPVQPELKAALAEMPTKHISHIVHNAYGKPFSVAGLGMRMRGWCNAAGLPQCSMHGLRKARARQLAEAGATNAEGRSITGHRTDAMFNHYAAQANRGRLALAATVKLSNLAVEVGQGDAENDG